MSLGCETTAGVLNKCVPSAMKKQCFAAKLFLHRQQPSSVLVLLMSLTIITGIIAVP